jgi:hypothetical protein
MGKNLSAAKAIGIGLWVVAAALFVVLTLWAGGLFGVVGALGNCLRPAPKEARWLPSGCVPTNDPAPQGLMRIVEERKRLSQATLEELVVCRSASRLTPLEQRYVGLPFGEQFRMRWATLTGSCCSCQSGRHILVIAAEPSGTGSILVRANLTQSRLAYLSSQWNKRRRGTWFWWWLLTGTTFFALSLRWILRR